MVRAQSLRRHISITSSARNRIEAGNSIPIAHQADELAPPHHRPLLVGDRARAPSGRVMPAPPSSIMTSRRFSSSNSIRLSHRLTSSGYRIDGNQSACVSSCFITPEVAGVGLGSKPALRHYARPRPQHLGKQTSRAGGRMALSCLGAFRTPTARACGQIRVAGVGKPAQQPT